MLFRATYARHSMRHGIRHTAALSGRRTRPRVPNGRLRHRLIGSARVSTAAGSQSLAVPCDALQDAATPDLPSPSGFPPVRQCPSIWRGYKMRSFAYPSILSGARTVMSEHDVFDRVLAAVHAATLDETRWPATSALIDEAVKGGTKLDQMAEENQTTWPLGRVSENGCAKGGVRMVERQRRGGRACCVRDDSCRRSAPGCGRDESADRAARQSAVRSRRSRSIR